MKVFIADDSRLVQERLATMLNQLEGVEIVGQAQTAPEAISAIQSLKPEVVILDIRMPGGTGIDVLRAIKQARPAPVAIMLTNFPYWEYRQTCLKAGADFFFDKSSEFDKIPEVFERLQRGPTPDQAAPDQAAPP